MPRMKEFPVHVAVWFAQRMLKDSHSREAPERMRSVCIQALCPYFQDEQKKLKKINLDTADSLGNSFTSIGTSPSVFLYFS